MKKRRGLADRGSSRRLRNRSVPRLERVEDRLLMAVFVVTSTNDNLNAVAGDGTLRGEILASNATTTANTIDFMLPAGVQTIALKGALPPISTQLLIDGTTATGFNNKPLIQITGINPSFEASGPAFTVNAGGSEIKDLIINGFTGDGIDLDGGTTTVDGCYIGLDPTGKSAVPNTNDGILVASANNTIGGLGSDNPNVISSNGGNAIEINGVSAGGNVVTDNYIGTDATGKTAVFASAPGDGIAVSTPNNVIGGGGFTGFNLISGNEEGLILYTGANTNLVTGNYIGTDITGNTALPNVDFGVFINGGTRNTIGGITSNLANVISGNGNDGVRIQGANSSENLLEGDLIGVGANGTTPVGNGHWGVQVNGASNNEVGYSTFQGDAPNYGNTIEHNDTLGGAGGVTIVSGINDGILSNDIYENGSGPGILLNGANNGVAAPVLTSVQSGAGETRIVGTLSGTPNTPYRIQFFYSQMANVSGIGDGQNYIGSGDLNVTTNSLGNATINTTITPSVPVGDFVTATATQNVLTLNDTSDFSGAVQATQAVVADLAVSTSVSSNTPELDQPYTITLTVSNNGPDASSNGVVLTDTLPTNATVTSVSAGTITGGVLTDDLGSLADNATDTITIQLKPTTIGNFDNTAVVTGPDLDPDLSNNTSTISETVVPFADLGLTLTPSATTAPVGSPLNYTLSVNNFGPSVATGTVVTVQFPADFTNIIVQPDQGSYTISNTNLVTINTGILPASSESIIQLTATPNQVEQAVTTVIASSPVDPSSVTTSATVTVSNAADLAVAMSASPNPVLAGQDIFYSVVVTNNGPSAASEPVVTDTLPAGLTYDPTNSSAGPNGTISISNGVVTASLNPLLAGSSDTITIAAIPAASGLITNTVNVGDPDEVNPIEIDPDLTNNTATISVPVSPADLSVNVINPANPLFIGTNAVFQIQVENAGPAAATNVILTDGFSAGAKIIGASVGQFSGSSYNGNLGTLASGQTETITIVVQPAVSGTLIDAAAVSSDEYDPDSSNNTSSSSNLVSPADLGVIMFGATTPVLYGTELLYVVTVTNFGPATATNVAFTDTLPSDAILEGLVPSQGVVAPNSAYTTLSGDLGTLAPGASATVSIAMLPLSLGNAVNSASVTSDEFDPISSNNSASYSVTVFNQPGTIQFASTFDYVSDNAGSVTLLVDRTNGTLGTVSATYYTTNYTAIAGQNYVASAGTVTFQSGQQYAAITIPVLNDGQIDGNHGFFVSLALPTGGSSIGSTNNVAGVIVLNTNRDLVPPDIDNLIAIPNGNQIDGFVLYFDKAMNPATASLLSNYYVFLMNDGTLSSGTPVPLAQAIYNPVNETVTLVPTAPLPSNRFYGLVANGSYGSTALQDVSGNYLYGSSGPHSNYVAYYGQGTQLVYDDAQGNLVTLNLTGGGIMGLYRTSNGEASLLNLYGIVPHATKLSGSVKKLSKSGTGYTYIGSINGLGAFGDVNSTLTTPQFYVGSAPVSAASVGAGVPVSLTVSAESATTTPAVTTKKATPKGPKVSRI